MRHVYVGDVGDFGKYGLLRALHRRDQAKRLGVVWYLTDERELNNDGRHDGYLKSGSPHYRESFRECDEDLYRALLRIRSGRRLNVRLIEMSGVLPASTRFYSRAIPRALPGFGSSHQWELRNQWHEEGLRALMDADHVFTDPDNGIMFSDVARPSGALDHPQRSRPSRKHSYWSELDAFLDRGQSVVAYHHLGRQFGGHVKQICRCLYQVKLLGREAMALHYRRGMRKSIPGNSCIARAKRLAVRDESRIRRDLVSA